MPPTFTDEGAPPPRRSTQPSTGRVLVLSQHIETSYAIELVTLGGFGYLLKDRVPAVDESSRPPSASHGAAPRWTRRSSGASSATAARPPRGRALRP